MIVITIKDWIKEKTGNILAPKTFSECIYNEDGTRFVENGKFNGDIIANSGTSNEISITALYESIKNGTGSSNGSSETIDTSNLEKISNKVIELSANSTDEQYPSARCVYNAIDGITFPTVSIGTVTNLENGQEPTVEINSESTDTNVILDFGVVSGKDGEKGVDGSAVTRTTLWSGSKSASFTSGSNNVVNSTLTLSQSVKNFKFIEILITPGSNTGTNKYASSLSFLINSANISYTGGIPSPTTKGGQYILLAGNSLGVTASLICCFPSATQFNFYSVQGNTWTLVTLLGIYGIN